MDRAIKEIVSSIVQRSVSIATQTTKELVLKVYILLKPCFNCLIFEIPFVVIPDVIFSLDISRMIWFIMSPLLVTIFLTLD